MSLSKTKTKSTDLKTTKKPKKKFSMPSSFTILFFIILFLVVLSMILHWANVTTEITRQVVDGNGNPAWDAEGNPLLETTSEQIIGLGIIDSFLAIMQGFIDRATILVFILTLGGFVLIVLKSKALEALTQGIVKKMSTKAIWLIPILMTFFSFLGSTYGMAEESLGFYMLIIPLMLAAGFDTMTGMMIVLLGAGTGVLASTVNPFVISVAIEGTDISAGSGMAFRWISWILFTLIGILFVMQYARRVKMNPQKSVTFATSEGDKQFFLGETQEVFKLTKKRIAINVIFFLTFVLMVLYLVSWDTLLGNDNSATAGQWVKDNLFFFTYLMPEFGAGGLEHVAVFFLISSLIIAALDWHGETQYTSDFVDGARDLLGVVMIIATAAGVGYILSQSHMQELFVNGLSQSVGNISNVSGFLIVSFLIFLPLSFLIPSTSGFAGAIFPLWAPLATGISASAGMGSVMAFSFASGILNLFTPTSGVVMGAIAISRVSFDQLIKGIWPYVLTLIVVAITLLGIGGIGNLLV